MDTMWFSKLLGQTENSRIANENLRKNTREGVLNLRGRTDRYKWKTFLALVREVYLITENTSRVPQMTQRVIEMYK